MEKLYVLYDPKCELCERLKDWLLVQRTWLGLSMVPAGSEKAHKMFPELEKIASENDLAVISDSGEVYLNSSAWIIGPLRPGRISRVGLPAGAPNACAICAAGF
jgi:predicted DCC family thiol-disulfide oxidoreductase YuxK